MKASFCNECGAALDAKGNCPNETCKNHSAKEKPTTTIPPIPEKLRDIPTKAKWIPEEKDKLIVPDCIVADQDEIPIKQYDIARLQTLIKGARAEGRLQVTNKRVLFRSIGTSIVGPTSLEYEFSIEEIAGIEIRREARFNFFTTLILCILSVIIVGVFGPAFEFVYNWKLTAVLFPVLLAMVSFVVFFAVSEKKMLRFVLMSVLVSALPIEDMLVETFFGGTSKIQIIGSAVVILAYVISLLYIALAPNLVVNIKTKGGTPSVEIRRKDGLFSYHHNEYTGFSQVMPGPDTDLAMHELGALIREVQQTGRFVEKESI